MSHALTFPNYPCPLKYDPHQGILVNFQFGNNTQMYSIRMRMMRKSSKDCSKLLLDLGYRKKNYSGGMNFKGLCSGRQLGGAGLRTTYSLTRGLQEALKSQVGLAESMCLFKYNTLRWNISNLLDLIYMW